MNEHATTSLSLIALIAGSFIIGSIPVGFVLGKLRGIDIRQHGSGNIGATNAARVLGKKLGAVTLLLDMMKGAVGALAGYLAAPDGTRTLTALTGLAAIAGHCFSPVLRFKGGKGVATAFGAFLIAAPVATVAALAGFIATFAASRIVSLSSIVAAVTLPCAAYLMDSGLTNGGIGALAAGAAIVIGRHHANIARLIAGTEPRFSRSASGASAR